ncbi:MAG: NAD+ synthase [Spirochaetaceae bacterium]|nr:MAG: NAD+ synthase [Spirochaetaceae bacterium]
MKIAIAQMNSTIADFKGNAEKILTFTHAARKKNADLVVFPELALCGYPPMDLLDQDKYVDECLKHLRLLQHELPKDIGIILGYIDRNRETNGKSLVNTASLIYENTIQFSQNKTLLPTYDVFDEARYFQPASQRKIFSFKGIKLGIAICEDVWWEQERHEGERYPVDPVSELLNLGARLVIVPSASPFYSGKPMIRKNLCVDISSASGVPVAYANMVGGNDSLIFDGQSMYISGSGESHAVGKAFEEDLLVVDTDKSASQALFQYSKYEELMHALVLGIRDYCRKCGFSRVHLGLSGGIDSALVAVLATMAMGKENVTAFSLPSRYSSEHSKSDAAELAKRLGIKIVTVPIETAFSSALQALAPVFEKKAPDTTEENLQARIRGLYLMAYANKFGSVLLNTGNKSELATGYCTLYGDMCGSLAVIGDLFKTEVYALCKEINSRYGYIPESIITKPPSAELKPDQTDQDTLPPYEKLDDILREYIINNMSLEDLCAKGYEKALVHKVLLMIGKAEYKRRQAPPVLKVSEKAFGMGRRIPIARKFFE